MGGGEAFPHFFLEKKIKLLTYFIVLIKLHIKRLHCYNT